MGIQIQLDKLEKNLNAIVAGKMKTPAMLGYPIDDVPTVIDPSDPSKFYVSLDNGMMARAYHKGRTAATYGKRVELVTDDQGNYEILGTQSGLQSATTLYFGLGDEVGAHRLSDHLPANAAIDLSDQNLVNVNKLGVGTASPAISAIADFSSTTQGVLLPRLTTTQRTSISSPALSLVVFDIDLNKLYFWDGAMWKAIGGNGASTTRWEPLIFDDDIVIFDHDIAMVEVEI